ncbi:MAG: hypothetical protein QXG17_02560 [Sulfolobales archaeon]
MSSASTPIGVCVLSIIGFELCFSLLTSLTKVCIAHVSSYTCSEAALLEIWVE